MSWYKIPSEYACIGFTFPANCRCQYSPPSSCACAQQHIENTNTLAKYAYHFPCPLQLFLIFLLHAYGGRLKQTWPGIKLYMEGPWHWMWPCLIPWVLLQVPSSLAWLLPREFLPNCIKALAVMLGIACALGSCFLICCRVACDLLCSHHPCCMLLYH